MPDGVSDGCRTAVGRGAEREALNACPFDDRFEIQELRVKGEIRIVPVRRSPASTIVQDNAPAEPHKCIRCILQPRESRRVHVHIPEAESLT